MAVDQVLEMTESNKGALTRRLAAARGASSKGARIFGHWLPVLVALLLLLAIAYLLAGLTWRLLGADDVSSGIGMGKQGMPLAVSTEGDSAKPGEVAKEVAAQHLFGKAGVVPAPAKSAPVQARETHLNLKLFGVFVDEDPKKGSAIIGGARGEQKFYDTGEEVADGVKLAEVYPDHVVLSRRGRNELLRFPETSSRGFQGSSSPPARARRASSLGAYREELKRHPEKLLEQVAFVPVRSGNGSLKGYRLLPKGDRALYNRLGVRPSDLITSVNGISLDNDQQALKVISALGNAQQLSIGIIRHGQQENLDIDLSH